MERRRRGGDPERKRGRMLDQIRRDVLAVKGLLRGRLRVGPPERSGRDALGDPEAERVAFDADVVGRCACVAGEHLVDVGWIEERRVGGQSHERIGREPIGGSDVAREDVGLAAPVDGDTLPLPRARDRVVRRVLARGDGDSGEASTQAAPCDRVFEDAATAAERGEDLAREPARSDPGLDDRDRRHDRGLYSLPFVPAFHSPRAGPVAPARTNEVSCNARRSGGSDAGGATGDDRRDGGAALDIKKIERAANPNSKTERELSYLEDLERYIAKSPSSNVEKLQNFAKYTPRQYLTYFLARYELFKKVVPVHGSVIECG